MHDVKLIMDDTDGFRADLLRRKPEMDADTLLVKLIGLDAARRTAIASAQTLQERRNVVSKEIGAAMKRKDTALADRLKNDVVKVKAAIASAEAQEREAISALETELAAIPNRPLPEVPPGADETGNVELRVWGNKPVFSFTPKEHFDIGAPLGMDFESAARISGSRFVVLKGAMARMERALTQFMLNLHTEFHEYLEVAPPLMVREHAMFGTAQLPKFRNDQFVATRLDAESERMWLIPTAEVPLTNLVREQILDECELPLRMTASTPCFRAEAGAAGRDARGLIRQHQFMKVEMVAITTPEQSAQEHERMTACAEKVLKLLDLPYRVVLLCTGDMGFASRKTYDLEVWMPGPGRYREISSISTCGDFQARRMNSRFRPKGTGTEFVHTLNGSGVAVGRALAAIIENFQNEDGSVSIPWALRPYMNGEKFIR